MAGIGMNWLLNLQILALCRKHVAALVKSESKMKQNEVCSLVGCANM